MKFLSTTTVTLNLLIMAFASSAQVPNPASINKMAVYKASDTEIGALPDSLISYNITDPFLILDIFSGIVRFELLDCSDMKEKTDAFVYLHFVDGTIKVYHLFAQYSHIALKDDRENCFYVNQSARSLLETHAR